MKSHRIVLGLIVFVALAVALAWRFWSSEEPVAAAPAKEESAAPVKTAAPVTELPVAPAPAQARVAMPIVPAVVPASAPVSVAASDPSANSPDQAAAFNDAQARAMAAKQAAMQDRLAQMDAQSAGIALGPKIETDWGEIQVVDGVPMELTTSAGDPVTLTPTVRPDGTLALQLQMKHDDGNNRSEMNSMIITKPGQSVQIGVGNQSFKMTPTL